MGDGNGGTRLHESFQRILHQAFRLGIESGSGFIENQDGRILQNGTCNGDALSLSARQTAAAVADIGVVAVFRLHDEVVGIGNLGCLFDFRVEFFRRDLLIRIFRFLVAKGDVVAEGIVEEDGLLVDVTDELA